MTTTFSNVIRGVAFGDSWGNRNEFQKIDQLIRNNPQGPDLPAHLEITDDTQMTLYLADALDEAYATAADVTQTKALIADAFLTYRNDPDNNRAPGVTVMSSLGRLSPGGKNWIDATSLTSDGSGTVMRTSPVAFVAEDRWVGVAAFAAAITHGTANAIAAAILNVAILRDLIAGKIVPGQLVYRARYLAVNAESRGLTEVGSWLDGLEVDLTEGFAELARLLAEGVKALPRLQADPWAIDADTSHLAGMGGGWRSHETLVIALLAVDTIPNDPWLGLRRSVTSDGDSDTIGAVAGALLGAAGAQWPDVLDRLEPRYVRWIEGEADDYRFAPEQVSWYRRLLGRR